MEYILMAEQKEGC